MTHTPTRSPGSRIAIVLLLVVSLVGARFGVDPHATVVSVAPRVAVSVGQASAPPPASALTNASDATAPPPLSPTSSPAATDTPIPAVRDQDNSAAPFTDYNDIYGGVARLQTFLVTSATLARIDIWVSRQGTPAGPLVVKVVQLDAMNNPTSVLYEHDVAPSDVPTTPGFISIYPHLTGLIPGQQYGFILASPATNSLTDAYGWAFNDSTAYPSGVERLSLDAGQTWQTEENAANPDRSMKFITYRDASTPASSATVTATPASSATVTATPATAPSATVTPPSATAPSATVTPVPSATATATPGGGGVVTIDDEVQGPGPYQFNYAGAWQHEVGTPYCATCYADSYSASPVQYSYVTFAFTGTGFTLYGAVCPNCGDGALSIDGGSETSVDFIGPGPLLTPKVVYQSPTLPYGPHTFKVQVTGQQDPGATGDFVPIDRVDISGSPPLPTPAPTVTGTPPTATPAPSETPYPTDTPTFPTTPIPTATAGPRGYALGIVSAPGYEIYDFLTPHDTYSNYLYGPAIIINPDKSIDMWLCSVGPFDQTGASDVIRYRHSTDGGHAWTPLQVVLSPTRGSPDQSSSCDPGVVKYGHYYYLAYTGITGLGSAAATNNVFVARAPENPGTGDYDPTQPFEKWNGTGWGGSPVPIITFTGNPTGSYGAGEPSMVVKGDTLYLYYTWQDSGAAGTSNAAKAQTRVDTVPIARYRGDWPAHLTYRGVAINREGIAPEDSSDMKYVDALGAFVAVSVGNRLAYHDSFIKAYESTDGIHFRRAYYMNAVRLPYADNIGISGDAHGHIKRTDRNFVSYPYGPPVIGIYRLHLDPIRLLAVNSGAFHDDFAAGAGAWIPDARSWSVAGRTYRQKDATGEHVATANGLVFGSATYAVDVRLDQTTNITGGAGLSFCQVNPDDPFGASGYTALLEANGAIALYKAGEGQVAASAPIAGFDKARFTHLKVVKGEKDIQVYVDRAVTPQLDWVDQGIPFPEGFVSLTTVQSSARFDRVSMTNTVGDNVAPGAKKWTPYAGTWSVADDGYRQSDAGAATGFATINHKVFGEATYEMDVHLITATTPEASVGMQISKPRPDAGVDTGYLVSLKANGDLSLARVGQTVVADVPTGVLPTAGFVHLSMVKYQDDVGTNIQVYVGGGSDPQINYTYGITTDVGNGYTSVVTQGASALFTHVRVDTQRQPADATTRPLSR